VHQRKCFDADGGSKACIGSHYELLEAAQVLMQTACNLCRSTAKERTVKVQDRPLCEAPSYEQWPGEARARALDGRRGDALVLFA
jgi:hypothetical protein